MMSDIFFYRLDHRHVYHGYEESMHIGTFFFREDVEKVIDELIVQPGFKSYPRSCFVVCKIIVDDYRWKKGFIHTEKGDFEIE